MLDEYAVHCAASPRAGREEVLLLFGFQRSEIADANRPCNHGSCALSTRTAPAGRDTDGSLARREVALNPRHLRAQGRPAAPKFTRQARRFPTSKRSVTAGVAPPVR